MRGPIPHRAIIHEPPEHLKTFAQNNTPKRVLRLIIVLNLRNKTKKIKKNILKTNRFCFYMFYIGHTKKHEPVESSAVFKRVGKLASLNTQRSYGIYFNTRMCTFLIFSVCSSRIEHPSHRLHLRFLREQPLANIR